MEEDDHDLADKLFNEMAVGIKMLINLMSGRTPKAIPIPLNSGKYLNFA
ncbi:hypothetical protein INT82_12900 [Mannheimia haemolytica]|nr:hypothetical protein [Mannheimia haemolytica]